MPLKQGEKKKPEALVKGVEFIFSPGDWRLHTAHLCFRSKKEIEISIAACWNALRYPRCQRRSDHSNAFFFFTRMRQNIWKIRLVRAWGTFQKHWQLLVHQKWAHTVICIDFVGFVRACSQLSADLLQWWCRQNVYRCLQCFQKFSHITFHNNIVIHKHFHALNLTSLFCFIFFWPWNKLHPQLEKHSSYVIGNKKHVRSNEGGVVGFGMYTSLQNEKSMGWR